MLTATQALEADQALVYPSGIKDKEERYALLATYRLERSKIRESFMDHLEASYGRDNRPADVMAILRTAAWEEGHSYGYSEVEYYYSTYSELSDRKIRELDN